MAHEVETMAYTGATPWHGLGFRVERGMSAHDMMRAAQLDWTVDPYPIETILADGRRVPVLSRRAFVRSSDQKVMTVASPDWVPMQNVEAFDFMRAYVDAGGATMETCGSLRGGSIVWALANLGHSFEVTPGDKVQGYLLCSTAHVVGTALTVATTTVRVVCRNTLSAALGAAKTQTHYRQTHMSAFNADAAHAQVAAAHEGLADCERRYRTIAALKLNIDDAVRKVLAPALYPAESADPAWVEKAVNDRPARIAAVVNSMITAPGAISDNGWGVLNGVSHWADHVYGRSADNRMAATVTGGLTARAKQAAETLLMELAE